MADSLNRLGARLVHSTRLIDRAYLRFDRLRSLLVLALASRSFFEAHSKFAYDASTSYLADSAGFRSGLFPWEEVAIRNFFPKPPARVLLGGAGGGREAYPLVEMGYEVVAFEPAPLLARTMDEKAKRQYPALKAYCAGYEDLPLMRATSGKDVVDLRQSPLFDAAILGWCSLSHLVLDADRVAALTGVGALTRGPILVSSLPLGVSPRAEVKGGGLLNALKRRAMRHGNAIFTTGTGFARLLGEEEFRDLVGRSGLEIVHMEWQSEWPHAIVSRRQS